MVLNNFICVIMPLPLKGGGRRGHMSDHFKTTDRSTMAERKLFGTLNEAINAAGNSCINNIDFLYQRIKKVA